MAADLFAVLDGGAAGEAAPFVVVTVSCKPRGKGDPDSRIVFPRGGKPFVQVYKTADDRQYEDMLAWHAKAAMKGKRPLAPGTPIAIRVFVMIPIPKSWPKRDRDAAVVGTLFPTSRPDDDNYRKSLDAFNGVVWADDAQVCRSLVVKEYAEKPGLIIEVYTLP